MKTIFTILISLGVVLCSWSQITDAEYFIDTDPGIGNATSLEVNSGNIIDETFSIPTTGLTSGLHVLHIRIKGTNDIWSLFYRDYFHIHSVTNETSVPIVAAEYFFDTDPGVNNATDIAITEGFMVDETFAILVPLDMSLGFHYLYLRVKDANDNWSLSIYALFEVVDELSIEDFENDNFKVFPNPTSSILNFNFNRTSHYNLEILDLNGKKIKQFKTDRLSNTIDFSPYQNGMYIVHIIDTKTKKTSVVKVFKF